MAAKAVSVILRDGIIDALNDVSMNPYLNRTAPYVGVYCSERFDQEDGYDPKAAPFVSVHMPLRSDTETVSEHIAIAQFTVNLYVYFGSESPRDADESIALLANAIRVRLSTQSYVESLRRIGGFRNAPVILDEGWGRYGQDVCYLLTATYRLAIDNSLLITTPDP